MKHLILRTLKRFYNLKNTRGNLLLNPRPNASSTCIARCKTEIAMLDDEKYVEVEATSCEMNSLTWLHKASPGFPTNGSKITVVHEPSAFYNLLLDKCHTAQKRITLASLYLGTGELESNLVAALGDNLERSNGTVKINILLDYTRGSRGKQNSRTMLQPLLKGRWGKSCSVALYHTPKLRGILKALIPDRFNELVGLQHMKLYLFDDTLIISGANLSHDYFTNRQDRYIVIEDCKELCDFYSKLVERVSEFSFKLESNGTTTFKSEENIHPYKGRRKNFTDAAARNIKSLFHEEMEKRSEITKHDGISEYDTWIFPLIEMGQLNIRHDSEVTLRLLQTAQSGATLKLATGYFNLIPMYRKALLNDCKATCHLLTAHPTANGFYGAKGIAGGIPLAYTKIEESFYKSCVRSGQKDRVTLWEFVRSGWTYHAKGLWYSLPGEQKPCLTLIGSPNFGYRSVRKDLETQVALITRNEDLQTALEAEHTRLFSRAKPVDGRTFKARDRVVPTWVVAMVVLFRYFF
ncbi:CDP-diacylglycerol--glycerol-3-phosphate 3-phosphatidyltransferase, mitochondrial [Neodiprion fabricii]|uniref:CDP-diacylglycerol--glycerol-3-phosphate 3-phosphatidyltransferase, mitochondrial n=1 Tax=Neodiprion fabricii TaxID=2872261 RepID=UPI001ED90219|nr:CDP-diacylglycerol--glycerol-3-phosphate 3-phosphatidyltransferase, mitochondrial [Neodiprion fabricii]